MADGISKAIPAHGAWKRRLADAIASSRSEYSVEVVRTDNQCEFGRWLYGLPDAEQASPECAKVRDLHAKFHLEAAKTLALALAGNREEAERTMVLDGPYSVASSALTMAMMEWRRKLDPDGFAWTI